MHGEAPDCTEDLCPARRRAGSLACSLVSGVDVPYKGELYSLLTALLWANSVVLFRMSGRHLAPLALNLFKNVVGTALLAITTLALGHSLLPHAPLREYVLLVASGAVGVALADTFFFRSLNILGAGLSSIVGFLYSPFVIAFSMMLLGERLSFGDATGGLLILAAVLLSSKHAPPKDVSRAEMMRGLIEGAVSMALMALGVVMTKPVLDRSSAPLVWITTLRMLSGTLSLAVICRVAPSLRWTWEAFKPSAAWRITLPSAFLGSYIAVVVWLAGMKYTTASAASLLNQMSAIFILPLASLFLQEPITRRKAVAIAIALAGIVLVTFW